MPEFVLNRTYVLAGKGYMIRFEKGVPTYVPPDMANEAVAIGAECLDGPIDVLGPEEVPEEQLSASDRSALLYKAFDTLIARNERDDFGGDGKPTVAAVKAVVGFSITKKELVSHYQQYIANKQEP
jgi:hypothetical protein